MEYPTSFGNTSFPVGPHPFSINLGTFIKCTRYRGASKQFLIKTDRGTVLQSYDVVIAAKIDGRVYLDIDNWQSWSTTTGKYRNLFLREKKRETLKKIERGEYHLCELDRQLPSFTWE